MFLYLILNRGETRECIAKKNPCHHNCLWSLICDKARKSLFLESGHTEYQNDRNKEFNNIKRYILVKIQASDSRSVPPKQMVVFFQLLAYTVWCVCAHFWCSLTGVTLGGGGGKSVYVCPFVCIFYAPKPLKRNGSQFLCVINFLYSAQPTVNVHYTTLITFSTKYLMMCKFYTDVGGI